MNKKSRYRIAHQPKTLKCAECKELTRGYICDSCALKGDIRIKHGVGISSDYLLSEDDDLINGIAFLHACGAFSDFIEKVYSSPEMMFIEESTPISFTSFREFVDDESLNTKISLYVPVFVNDYGSSKKRKKANP